MLSQLRQKDIAELLSVDRRHVNVLVKAGMPKHGRVYNGPECIAWYVARREAAAAKRGASAAAESEESRKQLARYRKHRADLSEIEVKKARSELVAWSEVEAEWRARVVSVVVGLENFGDRVSGAVAGRSRSEVYPIVKEEVRTLRESYVREGRYCPDVLNADAFARDLSELVAKHRRGSDGGSSEA